MDRETRTANRPVGPPYGDSADMVEERSDTGDTGGGEHLEVPLQVRERDRYEIIAEHGRGGVGRVMRATDREFGRDVALKELLRRTPQSEARFVREAIITSRLEHPNVVPVHEAGRWPDGTPFYAMKLVSGRPLAARIDEAGTPAERLSLLDRVLAVADAIAFAHDRGVIHRDLKPSNVIVGDYGETIVIDWGLAKYVADPDDEGRTPDSAQEPISGQRTKTGTVLGTPAYMAPEQAIGGAVTKRTDVHALGAILLDVLAGRSRPQAVSEAVDLAIAAPAREVDRRIPAPLRSIARRAMAPSPWNRYADAKEFADDLRRFLAGSLVAAHRYSSRERVTRWISSHRKLVQATATAVVALLVASVWFLAREARLRGEAEAARQTAVTARRTAESERDRADRQTTALLEQQGRAELAAGHPFRAAPFLAEVFRRDARNLPVRWMLTESLRALDSLSSSFRANLPGSDPNMDATYSVAFSPDDLELAVGHLDAVSFWQPTGAFRRKLELPVELIAGSYDREGGKLLLTFGVAGNSPVWAVDAVTGKQLAAVPVGADVDCVSWSSDGRYVASVKRSGRVDIWSVASKVARVRSFAAAPNPVFNSLAMSPDGSLVAARGAGEVILASRATGALRRFALPGENVQQLVFSPDSRRLLATIADRSARVWDVTTGRLLGKLRSQEAPPFVAVFSRDGSRIVTADIHALHLWDASSTLALATFELQTRDPPYYAMFAHRGPRLATLGHLGQLRIWDLPQDRWARPLGDHRGRLRGKYLGDGDRIVTADEDEDGGGRIRVWNARTGAIEKSWPLAWDPESDIAVSPDGGRVALVGRDGRPRILDARSGRVELTLAAKGGRILDLAFSRDGHRLAASTELGQVAFWSADDGTPTGPHLRAAPGAPIVSIEFSPAAEAVVTSGGSPLRIWHARTGKVVQKFPSTAVGVAAYSRDGRLVVNMGNSREFRRIWNVATGEEMIALEAAGGGSDNSVTFSPDGSLVAASDEFGRVTIWDTASGAVLRTIPGPTEASIATYSLPSYDVDFSPDGKRLLATGPGYALIWNIEVDSRSPAEVDAVVAAKSPWQLVDGRLALRQP